MHRPYVNVTVAVIFVLVIVSFIAGCSSAVSGPSSSLSIKELESRMRKSVDTSSLRPSDQAKLKKLYDIDAETLDGFSLYIAPSNLKADELLLLKVKGAADIAAIKTKIAKRVDKQLTAFKDYLPEEYFLIQKHIVRTAGNYVLFVVSREAEKIAAAFDRNLK